MPVLCPREGRGRDLGRCGATGFYGAEPKDEQFADALDRLARRRSSGPHRNFLSLSFFLSLPLIFGVFYKKGHLSATLEPANFALVVDIGLRATEL